jgi:hypothetical protein
MSHSPPGGGVMGVGDGQNEEVSFSLRDHPFDQPTAALVALIATV